MAIINKIDELQSKQAEMSDILQDVSYDAVDGYIDNNVVDLASARAFLKKLSKLVLYMVKEN